MTKKRRCKKFFRVPERQGQSGGQSGAPTPLSIGVQADTFLQLFEANRLEFLINKYEGPEIERLVKAQYGDEKADRRDPQAINRIQYDVRIKIERCCAADPTSKLGSDGPGLAGEVVNAGGYSEWIVKCWLADPDNHRWWEDLYKITDDLAIFARIQSRLPVAERNIYALKSPRELYELVRRYMAANKLTRLSAVPLQDTTVLINDSALFVGIPKSIASSKKLGAGTRWCTTQPQYFQNYTNEGPLFVVIIHPREDDEEEVKFQLHFQSKSYMDAEDHGVELDEVFAHDHRIRPALVSFFQSTGDIEALMVLLKGAGEEVMKAEVGPLCTPEALRKITSLQTLLEFLHQGVVELEVIQPAVDEKFGLKASSANPIAVEDANYLRVYYEYGDSDLESMFDHQSAHWVATAFPDGNGDDDDPYDYQHADVEACMEYYVDDKGRAAIRQAVRKVWDALDEDERAELDDVADWATNHNSLVELIGDDRFDGIQMALNSAYTDAINQGTRSAIYKEVVSELADMGLSDIKHDSLPGHQVNPTATPAQPFVRTGTDRGVLSFRVSVELAIEALDNHQYYDNGLAQALAALHNGHASINTRRIDSAEADEEAFNDTLVNMVHDLT